jgi:ABC-type antimicrobial peptide transport system permease subunit
MTVIGGTVGLLASIWLGNLAGSLLFELKGYDPAVLVVSAALLGAVAMGAGFLPALRASRVEPMQALRYE